MTDQIARAMAASAAGGGGGSEKQDKLVSGKNIKTINGQDILGSGDLVVESKIEKKKITKTFINGFGSSNETLPDNIKKIRVISWKQSITSETYVPTFVVQDEFDSLDAWVATYGHEYHTYTIAVESGAANTINIKLNDDNTKFVSDVYYGTILVFVDYETEVDVAYEGATAEDSEYIAKTQYRQLWITPTGNNEVFFIKGATEVGSVVSEYNDQTEAFEIHGSVTETDVTVENFPYTLTKYSDTNNLTCYLMPIANDTYGFNNKVDTVEDELDYLNNNLVTKSYLRENAKDATYSVSTKTISVSSSVQYNIPSNALNIKVYLVGIIKTFATYEDCLNQSFTLAWENFTIDGNGNLTADGNGATLYYDIPVTIATAIATAEEVYECTYNTTTYEEVAEAVENKKAVVCYWGNDVYLYSGYVSKSNQYMFSAVSGSSIHNVYVNNENTWSWDSSDVGIYTIMGDYDPDSDNLDVSDTYISEAFGKANLVLYIEYPDADKTFRLREYDWKVETIDGNMTYTLTFKHPEEKGIHCFNLISTEHWASTGSTYTYSSTSTWEKYGKAGNGIAIADDGTISVTFANGDDLTYGDDLDYGTSTSE